MLDQVFGLYRFESGGLDELVRLQGASKPMDTLAKPLEERSEFAPCDGLVNATEVSVRCVHQLCSIDVAEGVGREVTD
jgi:hypothetical protein